MSQLLYDAWALVERMAQHVEEQDKTRSARRAREDARNYGSDQLNADMTRARANERLLSDKYREDSKSGKWDQEVTRLWLVLRFPAEPEHYVVE
jgi:hypothetical protein